MFNFGWRDFETLGILDFGGIEPPSQLYESCPRLAAMYWLTTTLTKRDHDLIMRRTTLGHLLGVRYLQAAEFVLARERPVPAIVSEVLVSL